MRKTVTYLEMTEPSQLRPGRPVPDLSLEPIDDQPDLIRSLEVAVGRDYGWRGSRRTEAEWAAVLADPAACRWAVSHRGRPVGLVELAVRTDLATEVDEEPRYVDSADEVEISTFGLVPDAVGRGLGGHALTLTIRQAWALHNGVTRVWLHTSTVDHPSALPNYERRGLRPYRTVTTAH